jgi:beta-glucosidase
MPCDTPEWIARHKQNVSVAETGNECSLLLLGDSITEGWRGTGKGILDSHFPRLTVANFGIAGDRTENVLWRLRHGELGGKFKPKVVMLMIGGNNAEDSTDSVEDIAKGVEMVVAEIRKLSPDSKVLLLGIFPRDEKPSVVRRQLQQVNKLIASLDDGKRVKFLDISGRFLARQTLREELMPDFLHPSEKGYEVWAEAVKGTLADMLK